MFVGLIDRWVTYDQASWLALNQSVNTCRQFVLHLFVGRCGIVLSSATVRMKLRPLLHLLSRWKVLHWTLVNIVQKMRTL